MLDEEEVNMKKVEGRLVKEGVLDVEGRLVGGGCVKCES